MDDYLVNEPSEFYLEKKDFTSLEAWKKCRDVKLFFYQKVIPALPKSEIYNLGLQIRKAAISITANIAEGYGRYYYQEGIQFYRIARSSLYELKDHLISCYDLNFVDDHIREEGIDLIEQAKVKLNGYIRYVLSKAK
ncbi:MAG: four helix bundle protein [FCB group bacterium]|nr:four helix bundle protein [FCB group bacterium]